MSVFSDLPLMIEPSNLAPRLDTPELILVDLTSAARYTEGHILGTRFIDPKHTQWGQPLTPGLLPAKADLEAPFGELSHRPETAYVVYDDEGDGRTGRFIWLLDMTGRHYRHYFNDGLPAWIADAQALDRGVPAPVGGPLPLTLHDEPSATRGYLQSHLGAADLTVWGARNPNECTGTKVLAAKAGHVPSAINFGWTADMDPARALHIHADITEILEGLGITPDKEVTTHRQTHHRSGFIYPVVEALGYPRIKGYTGSWPERDNHPDTPVEVRGMLSKDRLFICDQYPLPHHLPFRLISFAADCRATWFKDRLIAWFARCYQVDMREAQVEDLQVYEHFNAFFTRTLKNGVRSLAQESGTVLCPADGAISQLGPIKHGRVFQAKGYNYSLAGLLGDDAKLAASFVGDDFATAYLSPRDYHRVRMPLTGTLREMIYVPGRLFSVSRTTTENVPELFVRSGRVACLFDTERDPVAVVLVDTMTVASIKAVWAGLVTLSKRKLKTFRYDKVAHAPIHLEKGAELGHLKPGSTATVLFGPQQVAFNDGLGATSPVRMGECLVPPKQS